MGALKGSNAACKLDPGTFIEVVEEAVVQPGNVTRLRFSMPDVPIGWVSATKDDGTPLCEFVRGRAVSGPGSDGGGDMSAAAAVTAAAASVSATGRSLSLVIQAGDLAGPAAAEAQFDDIATVEQLIVALKQRLSIHPEVQICVLYEDEVLQEFTQACVLEDMPDACKIRVIPNPKAPPAPAPAPLGAPSDGEPEPELEELNRELQVTTSVSLERWLRDFKPYEALIRAEGYVHLSYLIDADEGDVVDLANKVGMTKPASKSFVKQWKRLRAAKEIGQDGVLLSRTRSLQ
eukprot:COSAG01_NODE_973_length_12368_cov_12.435732_3_plen_290_part_00